ncbi:MAG: hypothetical protein V2A54_06805 [Bacteroidota bacterium]
MNSTSKKKNSFFNIGALAIYFLCISTLANAQKEFAYLDTSINRTKIKFIKTFNYSNKENTISSLYTYIRFYALSLGANSFSFTNFLKNDSLKDCTLILDTYYSYDSILSKNNEALEKNTIYFLSDNLSGNKTYKFSINNKKKKIKDGYFIKYKINEGETIKFSRNGMSISLSSQQNSSAQFYTFKKGKIVNGPQSYGSVSLYVDSGGFLKIDKSLGFLLINILKECYE